MKTIILILCLFAVNSAQASCITALKETIETLLKLKAGLQQKFETEVSSLDAAIASTRSALDAEKIASNRESTNSKVVLETEYINGTRVSILKSVWNDSKKEVLRDESTGIIWGPSEVFPAKSFRVKRIHEIANMHCLNLKVPGFEGLTWELPTRDDFVSALNNHPAFKKDLANPSLTFKSFREGDFFLDLGNAKSFDLETTVTYVWYFSGMIGQIGFYPHFAGRELLFRCIARTRPL